MTMILTEEQTATIILIRAIEESGEGVFSSRLLNEALTAATNENPGLEWVAARANYLFNQLSEWYRSILQVAKVPANWTMPVALIALLLGFVTNLLGPTEKIHVIRNPVFVLISWNILVYIVLGVLFLRGPFRQKAGLQRQKLAPTETNGGSAHEIPGRTQIPWTTRYCLPRLWQFVHKIMFGFDKARALANVTDCFTRHWLSVAAPLVLARWRYLLHTAALCMATGAVGGMYLRGLVQGYEFIWTSTFITEEHTVSFIINTLFTPSFFVSELLNLGITERIHVASLISSEGDRSEAWIHLFAITVVIAVVIPRGILAFVQIKIIEKYIRGFGLALDKYYGEVIEAPIREILKKEIALAITSLTEDVASFVGRALYDEQIVPKLKRFRDSGGRISDLKMELATTTESFSPRIILYIAETAVPQFDRSLSQRIGEIIKSVGTDFVILRDPETVSHELKIDVPEGAERGLGDRFSMAIAGLVGTAISVTFATVAGGLGEQLGVAIVVALLGTTGPVGFLIGLVAGAVMAAGAWWLGKDKITETIENVNLPALAVRAALRESKFNSLIADGRRKCEASVKDKIQEKLVPIIPVITDQIVLKIRSFWRS